MIRLLLHAAIAVSFVRGADDRRVEIAVHGDDAEVPSVVARLRELLGHDARALVIERVEPIDIAAAVAPGAGDPKRLAQVYIELDDGEYVTVLVVDGARERVLVRHVSAPTGTDEATREAIGTIVASAIEALGEGARIGIERARAQTELDARGGGSVVAREIPEDAEPEVPARRSFGSSDAPTQPSRAPLGKIVRLVLEPGWRLQGWSQQRPAVIQGPALGLMVLATAVRLQPGAGITAQYRLPIHVRQGQVDTRVDVGSLRAFAAIQPPLSPRVGLRARLGFGVDLVGTRTRGLEAPRPRQTSTIPTAHTGLGIAVKLAPRLALAVDAVLDIDLVDTRFVLEEPERTVFDPWRLRPGASLTLAWDLVAPARSGP